MLDVVTGTRYRLLSVSLEGATLDEISVTVNQQQRQPLPLSCLLITSRDEVPRAIPDHFRIANNL